MADTVAGGFGAGRQLIRRVLRMSATVTLELCCVLAVSL